MHAPKTKHDDFLGVRSLTVIIIVIVLLSGIAYLIADRVRIELGVWCYALAVIGPLGCLFLVGMLFVAFFREGRRNRLALWFGVGFGLAPLAIYVFYACVFATIAVAKPSHSTNSMPVLKNRAIVVFCDKASGKVLDADSLAVTNLVGSIVYTNGPSVSIMCLGELVNPQVKDEQISGAKVTLICQDHKIAGIYGQTIIFHVKPSSNFLYEVQTILVQKQAGQSR